MKAKKFLAAAVLCSLLFAGTAFAFQPEDALSARPDDSLYAVFRLEDISRLLKWALSAEDIKLYAPLIFDKATLPQATFVLELASKLAEVIHMRSVALNVGITRNDIKDNAVFFQMAFTVAPEAGGLLAKIADGTATASDVAQMLAGDKTTAEFLEMMLEVETDKNNILKVNETFFMTAKDDLVLIGASLNDIRLSLRALAEEDTRFLAKTERRFSEKDFSLLHIDYATAADLDDEGEFDELDARKYFEKPFEVEYAYNRLPDKFTVSMAMNLTKALRKEYADQILKTAEAAPKVKGGNMDITGVGGKTSPLVAVGSHINFEAVKNDALLKPIARSILRNLRVRFGISEEEASDILNCSFSAMVNGTVTFEGFKIPALYMSFTGKEGAAAKVFDKITKSQHFSKVQEGIYQLDTSISPIACLVQNRGETIGVDFAELASFSEKPEFKPKFAELLERESISSIWIDFAGIQDWINSDDNGVFATLTPLAALMGYGKYVKALQDVLNAELSVPSMSIWAESVEVVHSEFEVKEIDAEKGLFATLLRIYQDFKQTAKPAPAESGDKKE